jgi:hypothetical protein
MWEERNACGISNLITYRNTITIVSLRKKLLFNHGERLKASIYNTLEE